MRLAWQFVEGFAFDPLVIVAFFLLGVLTLVFSMIVASRLAGGIDFGSPGYVFSRSASLLFVITLVNFFTCGILIAGAVWYFGLMFLFDLDFPQARLLTKINWGMNLVWKALLLMLQL